MTKPVNATFRTLVLVLFFFASVIAQGQDPQKAKMTPDGRGYLEYLPSGYSTSSEKYPVIVFLHGSGERGTGSPTDLEKVKRNGPPKYIAEGHDMCFTANGKTECFIVLSPQTIDWSWKGDVIPFIKWALANYKIDPERVFVTGLSMGGEGAWLTSGLYDNSPNLLAGIAVMAGRGTLEHGINTALRKINVWAFHGDADTALGIGGGLLPITGMLNLNAIPAPIWTVYPGVGHGGCWERAYRTDHMYHNPNVYEWFLTKRRSGSDIPDQDPEPEPEPPVVDAGDDKTITLPTASTSFTATASDADGQVNSYTWTKLSGPAVTMNDAGTQTLSVSNAVTGTYVFRVTVKDSDNQQDQDDVQLTVNSTSSPNTAPTVNAGLDKTIQLPSSSAQFTATAKDLDGTIASYQWTKISGGSIVMSSTTSRTVSLTKAVAGTYSFKVTVTDNKGATGSDVVNLVVSSTSGTNQPPVVTAGDKKYIYLPTNYASFTATASDPDGSIVSYQWTKIGGGVITMSGTTTSKLSLSNAVECTYVFQVTVKDNKGATASAIVRLAVKPPLTTAARESTSAETLQASTESVESTFSVGQNYPNPFIGKTTIPFTLPEAQHVVLKIFNNSGNEIATILNEDLPAGEHIAEVDTDQISGMNSGSGIYYYKLLTLNKIITHRMIVGK